MKFRKKPIVIEATQWFRNGDHPLDYSKEVLDPAYVPPKVMNNEYRKAGDFEGDIVRYYRRPDGSGITPCKHCGKIMNIHGWIDTLEGGHIVCPGDWVITGVHGEHYPCKPDIFAATYEPAEIPKQEPAQAVPVAWMVTRAMAEPTLEWAKPKKHSCLRYEPLYTHPAPLDPDTRKMVLELCRLVKIDEWIVPLNMLERAEKIIERLEAGE